MLQAHIWRPDRTTWLGLGLVLSLHVLVIGLLASFAPTREVLRSIAPMMVELIQPQVSVAPERPIQEPPRVEPKAVPPPRKQQEVKSPVAPPQEKAPVISAPASASTTSEAAVTQETRPNPPSETRAAEPAAAPTKPQGPGSAALVTPAPAVVPPSFNADYLDNPAPAYPLASKRMGEEGRVLLRVQVEANGLPSKVEVRTSSGSERLDNAALEAVKRWKFVPAKQGEKAVPASVVVPITFNLKG